MEENCFSKKDLSEIISEYKKSIIQSEAEVRSKLIVPLTDYLGYPSELRAEEFPVHGFEGGKKKSAKNADYLFFTEKDFANHREFSKRNQDWVYQHSLFVIEAKKPGEMPEVFGQPEFYTVWTRAVAYMITDGISVKGYYYNPINSDCNILDCHIEDLPLHEELDAFSYKNVLSVKQGYAEVKPSMLLGENEVDSCQLITSEEELNLPEESYEYMRQELGGKAKGLNKLELLSLFLDSIDMYLKRNVRYDIPGIMFNIPRETFEAYQYVDNMIFPVDKGVVEHFFWNEFDRYHYESKYISADVVLKSGQITVYEVGFHVFDRYVSARLDGFAFVKKIFSAGLLRLQIDDAEKRCFILNTEDRNLWESKEYCESIMAYWVDNLEKMKIIEDYYDIEFSLKFVNGEDNLNTMYSAIENVYAGIALSQNCFYNIAGEYIIDGFEVEEPTSFQEGNINLRDEVIHDIVFRPQKSVLLPVAIKAEDIKSKDEIIQLPACCLYDIVDSRECGERRKSVGELQEKIKSEKKLAAGEGECDGISTVEMDKALWQCVIAYQNYPFYTTSGLPFSYTIKKKRNGEYSGELEISRKEESKTLTRSSVLLAFHRVLEGMEAAAVMGPDGMPSTALILPEYKGPKSIGQIFGISYVYSLFWKWGLIKVPEKVENKLCGKK